MGSNEVEIGVAMLRRAGLAPTRRRVALAGLAFAEGGEPASAQELRDRALDNGLYLDLREAEEAMAEFRRAGMITKDAGGRAEGVSRAARVLAAMANPHRLAVLRHLAGGERCVGDLLNAMDVGQSALSQHLARLRMDGLVRTRRQSARIYYSLAMPEVSAVLRGLGQAAF
ncbi:MAG: metalloregulator ArsR/SmtB family transcription factor [Pseudomonadota bacterium]